MSLYLKPAITAVFYFMNLNYVYLKKIYALTNNIFAYKKTFSSFIFRFNLKK